MNGGPVSITHPEITRYFMTIPEASQLVLQASALSERGEVFVLDMGQPVKIIELAKAMITFAGKKVKINGNDDESIEIKVEGLRPGEKMHEELFIGDNFLKTDLKKIMVAKEKYLPWPQLALSLKSLNLNGKLSRDQLNLLKNISSHKSGHATSDHEEHTQKYKPSTPSSKNKPTKEELLS